MWRACVISRKASSSSRYEQRSQSYAQLPARTRDGRRIEVVANVGSPEDVDAAVALAQVRDSVKVMMFRGASSSEAPGRARRTRGSTSPG
jgi:signal transduction protein with GAF and PtsI domain